MLRVIIDAAATTPDDAIISLSPRTIDDVATYLFFDCSFFTRLLHFVLFSLFFATLFRQRCLFDYSPVYATPFSLLPTFLHTLKKTADNTNARYELFSFIEDAAATLLMPRLSPISIDADAFDYASCHDISLLRYAYEIC